MGSLKELPPPSLAVFVNSTLPPRSAAFAVSVGKLEEGGLLPGSSEGCFQVLLSLRAYLGAECRRGAESRGGLPGKSLPFEAVSWGVARGKPQNVLLPLGHVFIQVASGKNEQQGKTGGRKRHLKGALVPSVAMGPPLPLTESPSSLLPLTTKGGQGGHFAFPHSAVPLPQKLQV